VINQGAQEKAQAEIDAVVGGGRLPTMDDRPLLPYLDAIFRETLRYSPVVPLCERFRPLFGSCCSSSFIIQRSPMLLLTTTCMMDFTFQRVNIKVISSIDRAFIDTRLQVLSSSRTYGQYAFYSLWDLILMIRFC